ncbi:MAG: tRNA (adenosine(37)-N6)-threonylcarbamoyltransferase complex ATPase subunit type 1 TsaE [Armatimonadetes bacterium]|nr:tRNA (adenosine(37)-N6)-threonylcarbamoyltransferase complex ATPase subunit type 1 TsaE [Armatimonadota bacterium]
MSLTTRSEEDTREAGRRLGRSLRRGDLVALTGDLGTGKTVLARGIAEGLGASGYVASPTFTLIREYAGPTPMYHVDLFRLTPTDATDLGLEEVMDRGVTVIEWAEKAPHLLRPPLLRIEIAFGERIDERILRLAAEGEGPAAAAAAAAGARTPA